MDLELTWFEVWAHSPLSIVCSPPPTYVPFPLSNMQRKTFVAKLQCILDQNSSSQRVSQKREILFAKISQPNSTKVLVLRVTSIPPPK